MYGSGDMHVDRQTIRCSSQHFVVTLVGEVIRLLLL